MFLKGWIFWRRSMKKRMIESGRISRRDSLAFILWTLLDIAALHDGRESICQLVHYDLGQVVARHTRNITVADGVLGDQNVIAETSGIASGRGNTDVCLRL